MPNQGQDAILISVPSTAMTRRRLLDYALSGSMAGFLVSLFYPVLRYLIQPAKSEPVQTSIKVGKVGDLPRNTGKVFPFNDKPAIIINTEKGELKAFTAVCTHLECTVQYRGDLGHIWCACHNGHYDLNGRNIAGPPPRPLEQFKVNVIGDEVFLTKQT